ncbi:MAG: hypothetical protein Q4D73_05715 [Actinomycetaceae bacterium]|nr:hypothetical protein [Actinomycetaceae bacterium]
MKDSLTRGLATGLLVMSFFGGIAAHTDEYEHDSRRRNQGESSDGTVYVKDIIEILSYLGEGDILVRATNGTVPVDEFVTACFPGQFNVPGHYTCRRNAQNTPNTSENPTKDTTQPPSPTPLQAAWQAINNSSPTPATLNIQPPKGWTLTNIDTIFFLTNTNQTQTTNTIMGPATLNWKALSYTFNYGDGTPPDTRYEPGASYPNHTITHIYKETKDYTPTVTIRWGANVTVAGQTYEFLFTNQTQSETHLEVYKADIKLKTNE